MVVMVAMIAMIAMAATRVMVCTILPEMIMNLSTKH